MRATVGRRQAGHRLTYLGVLWANERRENRPKVTKTAGYWQSPTLAEAAGRPQLSWDVGLPKSSHSLRKGTRKTLSGSRGQTGVGEPKTGPMRPKEGEFAREEGTVVIKPTTILRSPYSPGAVRVIPAAMVFTPWSSLSPRFKKLSVAGRFGSDHAKFTGLVKCVERSFWCFRQGLTIRPSLASVSKNLVRDGRAGRSN